MDALNQIALLLINTGLSVLMLLVWLRFLLQVAAADFYNPMSQFVVRATTPLLNPLRRIVPGFFGLDIAALVLIVLSPAVSGTPTSMFPNADWAIFPLSSPGLVSIPIGFLAGIIGTYLGKPDNFDELQAEMEVRSLTGVGVEAPVDH